MWYANPIPAISTVHIRMTLPPKNPEDDNVIITIIIQN